MNMKPQDILFIGVALVSWVFLRQVRYFVALGILLFFIAIPLFAFHVFFTAERLTWYAAFFISSALCISHFRSHTVQ